jgi:Ca-activated chloride channel family protein
MLVMDISKSMLAEDIAPNRIEAAKQTIDTFLQKLDSDRIGIILFAGKPFASVPLTFDYDAVRNMLTDISTDSINQTIPGLSGTAIGDAILSATDALDRNTEKEKNRTKTIILLTDGEANVGINPEIATQYAKEKQVKIYTIGIGKTDGTPLYITDPLSGKKQYFVDESGKPIIASIDEKSLKSIAETTGGKYFLASDNESLTSIFTTLSKLEKTEIRTKTVTTNESLASYLVYISLFLLVIIGYYHLRVIH